jgi:23S rRNA (uridine2552-2'-O)-methyltransferase
MAKRSKSSERWLREHFDDPYVARAQADGFRSRAVYKLQEIDTAEQLFRRGMKVVDLGAAPGGWSQYAATRVSPGGVVIATDRLPIDPLPGVDVVIGDFREEDTLRQLEEKLQDARADLVLSDMAPNLSGSSAVDQPKAMYLCELALQLAVEILNPKGAFLVKVFQGAGSDAFLREVRERFRQVRIRKPEASRSRSREVYLLARELRDV